MEIKNKDNTKGVIVKRVSDKDLAAECRSAAKANFVYDRFIKPITYLGKVPDTYEDNLIVNDIALCKINSMNFSTVNIKFTRFNKLTYDKKSKTFKVNKSTINVKLGQRLRRRVKRTLGIDITFTITDLTPWLYNPVENETKFPDIGENK